MTIHEINEAILECVDPETGEVDAERLCELEMERNEKIEGVANWVLELGGDNDKIDAEIARLQAMKKRNDNKVKSLKDYLNFCLAGQKYKGSTVSVTFRTTRAVAEISEDALARLPDEFKIVKTEVKPDKRKIKAAIDEGWHIAGVGIEERVSVTVK